VEGFVITFLGCDLAMNHSAFVLLDDEGKLVEMAYSTEKQKSAGKHTWTWRWDRPVGLDQEAVDAHRLKWNADIFDNVLAQMQPSFVAVEGYAYDQSGRAYQIGEVGGVMRLAIHRHKAPYRIYDPTTIKMFAAHNGTADKNEVADAVQDRWHTGFGRFNNTDKDRTTEQDLSDAYTMAVMCLTEWRLRYALIRLDSLHAKEIQVFQRVTKANPVNLLSRDWIMPLGATVTGPVAKAAKPPAKPTPAKPGKKR
jgi:Holliday junction resolvasome RuvABC endonuclease subunit